MKAEWAIDQLDTFIRMAESHPVESPRSTRGSFPRMTRSTPEDEITAQARVVEKIIDRVTPGWRNLNVSTAMNRWERHRAAAIQAREEVRRAEEFEENLGDTAPKLCAAELHDWIWDGARSLWQSEHYREAVEGAARTLNARTQQKDDRRNLSETKLYQEVFRVEAAEPGRPRLRRMPPEDSDTYRFATQRHGLG